MAATPPTPTFVELFTPKLVTVLREGYRLADFRADCVSGLTVAIVALPLSMAIAIASGVTPERGLFTTIVGGFIVSLLGGSRFQVGGPAGAFIVLVAATVAQYGVDGLLLATFLSGLMLLAVGLLRLGTFIKYIPYPVTVGFTAGIAVIILASQIAQLLGLRLQGAEPGALIPKLIVLAHALPTTNPAAVAITTLTTAVVLAVRRWRPRWPAFLIGVVTGSLVAWTLRMPIDTLGTRFGELPRLLPWPGLPEFSYARVVEVIPAALTFTLLGGIESLLSAVVADSMSGRRHRSNCELAAQGVANMGSALFGGFCVTGTIARTATNVRAGAKGPISGMLHAAFVLLFVVIAGPLASYIPLAALASVLAVVCWNMAERQAFASLLRATRGDAVVLTVTFLLVVFRSLIDGIVVGFSLGALLFLHRMAQSVAVEAMDDRADTGRPYDPTFVTDRDVVVCRITGAFFFGAAANVAAALDRLGERPKAYVIDVSAVAVIDSTAAVTIEGFARKAARRGAAVIITGAGAAIARTLAQHGVGPPHVRLAPSVAAAVAAAHERDAVLAAT